MCPSDAGLEFSDANVNQDVYLQSLDGPLQRISRDVGSRADANGASSEPRISGDGQSVVFRSRARNLESRRADNNETDDIVAVRLDRPGSRLVTRNRRGDQANGQSSAPALNYNGTRLAFESAAANLTLDAVSGQPVVPNGLGEVYVASSPLMREVIFRSGLE